MTAEREFLFGRTSPVRLAAWMVLAVFCFSFSCSAESRLAPEPPMGWNSWDAYGTTVNEQQVKANANVMAQKLARYGWRYVVVDIQWYEPNAQGHEYRPGALLSMDSYGRLLPAANRFPSAANGHGFKPLADYIHNKGLKFGIHIMRGIPRQAVAENLPIEGTPYHAADVADRRNFCRWNPDMWGVDMSKPGAQAYYDSIVRLYASWGVDFVKADDMGSHRFQPAEIQALSRAIGKSGRAIVLSISPGPAPISQARFLETYAQMWRISDDFWDDWKLLKQQFDRTRDWAPYIGKNGTWPDADMLPLGRLRVTSKEGGGSASRLTADEQRTLMTLWCIFRSPLIFGGDLSSNDASTTALITNREVLEVDQHSSANRQVLEHGNLRAWLAKSSSEKDYYLAIFNLGDRPQELHLQWKQVTLPGSSAEVRDLWRHKPLGRLKGLQVELRPHASVLYSLSQME